ncbi:MAG: ABC transporter permease [Bacillota bacterium]
MRIRESLRSSFKSLAHNQLRSFLTMLGVIIGVFSVVMLTSIGEGVKRQVILQVESLGANLLYVLPGKLEIKPHNSRSKLGVRMDKFSQNKSSLSYDDVLILKSRPNILAASGVFNGVDRLNSLNLLVSTTGVDEDFIRIRNLALQYGRFINKNERLAGDKVAVIGAEANNELFQGRNSLGKIFKLNNQPYRVIGVLRYKKPENLGPGSEDINVEIFLPITELLSRSNFKNIDHLIIKATSGKTVKAAEREIRKVLIRRHHSEDFSIFKQQDMLDVINNILGLFTAALGGIATISLIVGGIGIMNIMLVSVTERTREIGIRKAIGAKRRDILSQFLVEAVVLSLIGGTIGLLAGIAGSKILSDTFPMIHTVVSIPASVMALLFAFLVGGFFGIFPAIKAADLNPIEALRNE